MYKSNKNLTKVFSCNVDGYLRGKQKLFLFQCDEYWKLIKFYLRKLKIGGSFFVEKPKT